MPEQFQTNRTKAKKRIGIDARFYGPRQKGLGRYVQRLIENLEQTALPGEELEFVVFLRRDNWQEYQPGQSAFKKALADFKWYGFKEQLLMPWLIRRQKIDLMHFPHFNVPVFCLTPFVITIHDLILKRFPTRRASALGPVSYWFKSLAYHLVISLAIKRAKKIIAVSNFTKQDIIKYFKVPAERIKVIYEGAPDRSYCLPGQPEKRAAVGNFLSKFGVSKPYLLYVGNAYPHKNLENLIKAFLKVDSGRHQLVLVGEMDYFYRRLKKMVPGSALGQSVIFTDFVSDQELTILYQNASLYVFPSFYEGFGLPPLEAMSCRLPVASSNASCLPEILGSAAAYFNPEDPDQMAAVISRLLGDESQRRDLAEKGWQRIKDYNWQETARQTLSVYQSQSRTY